MIVHKDKMIIRESKKYLNTDEGKESQKVKIKKGELRIKG